MVKQKEGRMQTVYDEVYQRKGSSNSFNKRKMHRSLSDFWVLMLRLT